MGLLRIAVKESSAVDLKANGSITFSQSTPRPWKKNPHFHENISSNRDIRGSGEGVGEEGGNGSEKNKDKMWYNHNHHCHLVTYLSND